MVPSLYKNRKVSAGSTPPPKAHGFGSCSFLLSSHSCNLFKGHWGWQYSSLLYWKFSRYISQITISVSVYNKDLKASGRGISLDYMDETQTWVSWNLNFQLELHVLLCDYCNIYYVLSSLKKFLLHLLKEYFWRRLNKTLVSHRPIGSARTLFGLKPCPLGKS